MSRSELIVARDRALEDVQSRLDQEHAQLLDAISTYDALGAGSLSQEQLFDWFLAEQCVRVMSSARLNGWAEVPYVALEDMPSAIQHIEQVGTACTLHGLEPSRRQRRSLGHQAVRSSLDLLGIGKKKVLGDPSIIMTEYELDADSYPQKTADTRIAEIERFVEDWLIFLYEKGQEPQEISA